MPGKRFETFLNVTVIPEGPDETLLETSKAELCQTDLESEGSK